MTALGRRAAVLAALALAAIPVRARAEEGAPEGGDRVAPFQDARFGPSYVIADVIVRGNQKTQTSIIVAEIAAIGLGRGANIDATDQRVEAARYRLLALGYFLDVRLSVERGITRGAVVLVVEVEERGTIVVNELFPSTSAATAFWGGADVSETNFLGRGITLGAGLVASTKPIVLDAHAGLGLRLRTTIPAIGGPDGLHLSATALFNDGSEFYAVDPVAGPVVDSDPGDFVADRVQRIGGLLGVGKDLSGPFHVSLTLRQELVNATVPDFPEIDFMIKPGASRVGSVAAALDLDTRSDPVLPRSGMRIAISVEAATSLLGSSYDYLKTVAMGSFYWRMPRGHALGLHLFAGGIQGDAPFFDRFFVGDIDLLLPRRALGINFSTMPAPNLLDTSIAHHRYDDYAGRVLVEYAIPIWRRRGFVYGGDAFAAAGLFGMASPGDFLDGPLSFHAIPIALTGDVGLRLDTYVGIFTISIANALSRSSF